MSASPDCREARLAIGGDPGHLPRPVQQHIAGCTACTKFRDETLALEGQLKTAMELPLYRFRTPAKATPSRRFALAASLVLAVLVGAGAWLLTPQPALAHELIEHVNHEASSWESQRLLTDSEVAAVLSRAGIQYRSSVPVKYASPCVIRGHVSPHLVVQTASGPMTVIFLRHETVERENSFDESGYQGMLLPAEQGSIAIIVPRGQPYREEMRQVLAGS